MAGSVIIALEGVLRSPTGMPIREGVMLYRALAEVSRVILVLDDLETPQALHWLRTEGMNAHAELVETDPRFTGTELREYQVDRARARGTLDMLLDSSPVNIAAALKVGVVGLLFSEPRYQRPEFRPDADLDIKPWGQIEAEVLRQRDMLTKDTRTEGATVVTSD